MRSFYLLISAVIICIILCAATGCTELPPGKNAYSSGEGDGATPTTPLKVTYVTPYETDTPIQTTIPYLNRPPREEYDPYSEIYNESLRLDYQTVAFVYDLGYAPMIIDYTLHPDMVTDVKTGTSQYGDKADYSVTRTIPNPNAFFTLRVIDTVSGEEQGSYTTETLSSESEKGSLKIFSSGNFQVEVSGGLVQADVAVKVAPENLEENSL